jgi:hypothetical protein
VVTRLLLLLVLIGSGTFPWSAPEGSARPGPVGDAPDIRVPGFLPGDGIVRDGDELRLRLPRGPAALVAGSGVHAPSSTLREGLNHRSGLQLDPDGTPAQSLPGVAAPRLDGGEPGRVAHRSPFRAVPLFSSSIPPPHLA